MPYRIDIAAPPPFALDVLIEFGALDVEQAGDGLAAILPDGVAPEAAARALGVPEVSVSAAVARDNGSVWLLSPRAVRTGGITLASADAAPGSGIIRLADSGAFGTGHHPTTALCVEALETLLSAETVDTILDVGTGSGVLALTALMLGVPRAVGLDIDDRAIEAAAGNARLNGLAGRLQLVRGGPEAVEGTWPLVVANVLAAPLIGMAPVLVRRMGSRACLILSGIPHALEGEVRAAYEHLGLHHTGSQSRDGWIAVMFRSSW